MVLEVLVVVLSARNQSNGKASCRSVLSYGTVVFGLDPEADEVTPRQQPND